MEASSYKTCIVCRTDCTNKPRIKDSQGRYCCKECAERKRAAKQTTASSLTPASQDALADEPLLSMDLLADEAKAQASVATDHVIDLAPVSHDSLPAEKRGKAPNLRHSGLDTNRLKPTKCQQCGYDLMGLESLRCPECGAICRPKDKLDYLREDSRKLVRNTWLAPIITIASCLITSFVILLAANGGLEDFLIIYVGWAMMIPVGLFALWLCTLMFLEIDAPWGLTILRFVAVQSCAPVIASLFFSMTGLPMTFKGGGLGLFISAYLYSWLFDVEKWDAFWFALIQKVVEIAAVMLLAIAVESLLGP